VQIENQQEMEAALMRLGFSQVAVCEFNGNGITNLNRLRTLSEDSLDRLIKQIHQDFQGEGLFIPFAPQQLITKGQSAILTLVHMFPYTNKHIRT
jgi:hypothetical protein